MVCSDFVASYANVSDTPFHCFFSRRQSDLVIVNFDLDQVYNDLYYSIAIPVPCFVVSFIYILVAYFYIYATPLDTETTYRPVTTLSTASAMAALIDVRGSVEGEEEEKKRKKLVLQAQKAKLIAAQNGNSYIINELKNSEL